MTIEEAPHVLDDSNLRELYTLEPDEKENEVIIMLTAKHVDVRHEAILFTITKMYRSDMNTLELYEMTRGCWRVGKRREKAEYAMCVTLGIVHEVYKIENWYPVGTLKYRTRPDSDVLRYPKRWEFEGSIAHDLRDEYVGFSVGKCGHNPIRYRNI